MILYLDTSAFLQLYVEEAESTRMREVIGLARATCTHLITYAEMRAAFAKALRMRRLTEAQAAYQIESFEKDWRAIRVVGVDEPLIRRAGELAHQYGLRGYDSVHLAAAEAVWRMAGAEAPFRVAVFDGALAESARGLGLKLVGD